MLGVIVVELTDLLTEEDSLGVANKHSHAKELQFKS